jgi:eukaryotic-like serine/threonine-protein kinase
MNPESGTTLGSRYTLTDRVAAGGMGDVWRATDSVLGRVVAVKVMRASAAEDPTFANRFRDEARHSAGMSHQNIATVYDYGEDDGTAYLVMELVDGEPLSQLIARGPMNPEQVRRIIGQAALALAAAHAAGVVHRDVKPANILITPDGRVKLTDFGIARAVDGASHTRTGEVLGTPQYLSPEQALGKGATGASDLYALGIIAQEMLTGRKPFDSGSAVATALAQVNDPPPPLPDSVPSDLRRIIDQSLAKNPADRPTSAAAVAAALGMSVTGLAQIPAATSVVNTGDTDPDGTQVMDAPTGTELLGTAAVVAAAYPDYPATGYDPGYEDGVPPYQPYPPPTPSPEKRRGLGLWWIPIIVLLAAIGFFAWAYASNNGGGTPAVSTSSSTAATTTSASSSSAPTTITPSRTTALTTTQTTTTSTPQVVVNKRDFVGKSYDEAKGILEGAGWKDDQIKRATQPGKESAGTVVDIKPTGKVDVGTPITLTVSDGNATAASKVTSEGGDGSGD